MPASPILWVGSRTSFAWATGAVWPWLWRATVERRARGELLVLCRDRHLLQLCSVYCRPSPATASLGASVSSTPTGTRTVRQTVAQC